MHATAQRGEPYSPLHKIATKRWERRSWKCMKMRKTRNTYLLLKPVRTTRSPLAGSPASRSRSRQRAEECTVARCPWPRWADAYRMVLSRGNQLARAHGRDEAPGRRGEDGGRSGPGWILVVKSGREMSTRKNPRRKKGRIEREREVGRKSKRKRGQV